MGYAVLNDIPLSECMTFISGRVPEDMVEKVIVAGITVLVSKSVPTAESVELAEEYNLKLICKAWPDQCEIYQDYIDGNNSRNTFAKRVKYKNCDVVSCKFNREKD